jgi:heat shock protein HslJ
MKKALLLVVAAVIISAAAYLFLKGETEQAGPLLVRDYKNTEYTIDGQAVTLVEGFSEEVVAPGSQTKTKTRYFGNELIKDLNEDGLDDVVFLLTQDTGGSGMFFYVVAALNAETGYVGSEAVLLGDRIAPQTIESGSGKQIIINYADRAPNEPMTAQPSIGKSLRLILDVDSMQFGEVASDFEGEVDPARMSLGMKTWAWQRADYSDGRVILPAQKDAFTVRFTDEDSFLVTTDCNGAGGTYVVDSDSIILTDTFSTMMYCEESEEAEFLKLLEDTERFKFTSRGELIFVLKLDSGTATFR